MSRKSDQRLREKFSTREDLSGIPPRTVYVYAHNWSTVRSGKQFCIAARHRRARAYWSESKAIKATFDEAVKSAEVCRERAEKSYGMPYRVAATPSVVLSMVGHLIGSPTIDTMAWRQNGNGAITEIAASYPALDTLQVYRCALQRKRVLVPPYVIPAIEAILMSNEPLRGWLVVDYLGWNPNKPPLTQTLEDLLPVPVLD